MEQALKQSTVKETSPGFVRLPGAVPLSDGVNFALHSAHAEQVFLLLFDNPASRATDIIKLHPDSNSGMWSIFVRGVKPGQLYGYKVTGPYDPPNGLRFNPHKLLMDPYAKALTGKFRDRDGLLYGYQKGSAESDLSMDRRDNSRLVPKSIVIDDGFDWQGDSSPRIPSDDMIVYETHLRGFTAHPESGTAHPGTYLGFIEKIPYLLDLGVTSIELLPVQEHHIRDELESNGLTEYWGYNTIGFFAPEYSYASSPASTPSPGGQVHEFKTLVRELHSAGLEVILDVVYNHTGEENELGPTICFRGIDNPSYYALQGPAESPQRYYRDMTGCRNTLDIEKPAVLRLVMDSLRYWVQEMHVDGFRFDLAPVLGYSGDSFNPDNAFFTALKEDPVISSVKLIAEPWDVVSRQTGRFPAGWMEWNDSYRDTVRRFLRGDKGQVADFATRFSGSEDMFGNGEKSACSSINFITAHDGFTLHDLYSYEEKHNHENGEQNNDGTDNNNGFNCGVEGDTDSHEVLLLRRRMARNALLLLFCSRGIPMLLSGDELLRTQRGNNNAYCQDSEISWFPWSLVEQNRDMLGFCRSLIDLRRNTDLFRSCSFYSGDSSAQGVVPDIVWFGADLNPPLWDDAENSLLCCEFGLSQRDRSYLSGAGSLFMIFNMGDQAREVRLPEHHGHSWHLVGDTSHDVGKLMTPPDKANMLNPQNQSVSLPHSIALLLSVPTHNNQNNRYRF